MKFENGLWWPDNEKHLIEYGLEYQSKARDVALGYVTNKTVCLDIGAHVGIAALDFSRVFKHVFCFEPLADNYACLSKNTQHLDNITLLNYPLSDEEGRITLTLNEGNSGYTVPSKNTGGIYMATTLDSHGWEGVLNYPNVGLVKMDVEGFESLVVKGGIKFFSTYSPVILAESKGIGYSRTNPEELFTILNSIGYTPIKKIGNDYVFTKRK